MVTMVSTHADLDVVVNVRGRVAACRVLNRVAKLPAVTRHLETTPRESVRFVRPPHDHYHGNLMDSQRSEVM